MHIKQEYFKEQQKDIFFYTAKVLNPATRITWFIHSVVERVESRLKIIEFECKEVSESKTNTTDPMLVLDEKSNLRDFVYDMVGSLSKGERKPINQ